jgi:hypothetical protein
VELACFEREADRAAAVRCKEGDLAEQGHELFPVDSKLVSQLRWNDSLYIVTRSTSGN